ncbi:LD-carboxypeptidase, partial [Treponema pallidum]
PSCSMRKIDSSVIERAQERFRCLGLNVAFGDHVYDEDFLGSASVDKRVADLHAAFADKKVKLILTAIGGFNSNQLLQHIDYALLKKNPKLLCGFSDVTALLNAIHAKTGMPVFYGPHFSTFGMEKGIEFTIECFKNTFFYGRCDILASETWSDDMWFKDQEHRQFITNPGYEIIHRGDMVGMGVGGNISTFNLLAGTEYEPSLKKSILFIEDTSRMSITDFDRHLEALTQRDDFCTVRGILIGRFQKDSGIDMDMLRKIISRKKALDAIPLFANVDFGHTTPHCILPIGGMIRVNVDRKCITVQLHSSVEQLPE